MPARTVTRPTLRMSFESDVPTIQIYDDIVSNDCYQDALYYYKEILDSDAEPELIAIDGAVETITKLICDERETAARFKNG